MSKRPPLDVFAVSPSRVPDPALRLVLLHGLASSPTEFALLTRPLKRLGIELVAPEIEGYSHALLDTGARWADWVAAATRSVVRIAGQSPKPFVLGGLCTGALMAIEVARRSRLEQLKGIALLSPSFAFDGWSLPWWYDLRRIAYGTGIAGFFSMKERPPFGLKNLRMRHWVREQMASQGATLVGPARVPLTVVQQGELLSTHTRDTLHLLVRPTLVLHALEDEICRLQSVEATLRSATAAEIRLEVLTNSYHMITADNDRQRVAELLAEHVGRCMGRSASTLVEPAPSQKSSDTLLVTSA